MLQLHKNSGSARTAFENIKYFSSLGYEVHVACLTLDKNLIKELGAIPHKMIPYFKSTGLWRRKWYNLQVRLLRKKLKPELTLGHGDINDQDVLTLHNCVFLASELIHGSPLDPKSEMAKIHGQILRENNFKKMIANSELMKIDTIKRFNVSPEKIHVVYPAVDTTIFFPKPLERFAIRKRFGFEDKLVIALVTSGNFKKRGLDLFLEAIKLLPADLRSQADFRIVGKNQNLGPLEAKISFDPPMRDIENYYNAIDIFVLPARIEEFGRVVLEAMACGLPVITTDKVGAGELLEGLSREFVIPSNDAPSLTFALKTLIENSDLRASLAKINYTSAQKEAESKLSPKFDRIFNSLK